MKLAQRTAIITGAARGIGRAIAMELGREGASLVLVDLLPDVQETAEELKANGMNATAVIGNVTKSEESENVIQEALKIYGRIDILVNNAGITRDNLLLRMSEDDWDAVMSVNLKGTFNMTKASLKTFMKLRAGSIINIASVIGLMGNAGQANYAASKAGVIAFTKSMAKELGSRGIRVNAIAPGFIRSKMTDKLSEDVKKALMDSIPLGVLGEPEQVGRAALFLASDDANYITGQVLQVDGGMVM
jgi:3-oxoacyl-[acyl-carrier protein] reductase